MVVERRTYRQALDDPVGAERARHTAWSHGLHLAVTHSGQIGAQHIGRRLKMLFFLGQTDRIEATAPWQPCIGVNRQDGVHSAAFDAEFGNGVLDQLERGVVLLDRLDVHPGLQHDEAHVDYFATHASRARQRRGAAAHTNRLLPYGDATSGLTACIDPRAYAIKNIVQTTAGPCSSPAFPRRQVRRRSKDIDREQIDGFERPTHQCPGHRPWNGGRPVLVALWSATGHTGKGPCAPSRGVHPATGHMWRTTTY